MKHQLIVNILGTDRSGILSEIATLVSDNHCNILDSRQAVYGKEFSLTMILEGTQSAITRVECLIPPLCQRLDLLSMTKRTSEHSKQNLDHLLDIEISGVDTTGLVRSVTRFFAERHASISAFRQKTYHDRESGEERMRCKLVVNVPDPLDLAEFEQSLQALCQSLNLEGKVTDKYNKEHYEQVTSWQ